MTDKVLALTLLAVSLLAAGTPESAASSGAAAYAPVPTIAPGPAGLDSVPWQSRANCLMITERPGGCAGAGYFYVLGGHDETNAKRRSVYRFDPVANTWDSVAPMLQTADNIGACYSPHWNRIFVAGNYDPVDNKLQIYDVAADSWYYGADAPFSDYGLAAAALGPDVYFLWGSTNSGRFARYDPAGDSWHVLATCSGASSHAALCSWDGMVYASGGWPNLTLFKRYDPGANSWTNLPVLPQGRQGHGMDAFEGKIYVYSGGQSWTTPTANCYAFHTDGDSWTNEGPMVYAHIAGAYGGLPHGNDFLLHAAAGYNGTTRINSTEQGRVTGVGGGISPDSLYFKRYGVTDTFYGCPKAQAPNPVPQNCRPPFSFRNHQSRVGMDPLGLYVYEVSDDTILRRHATDDGSYTDFTLDFEANTACRTDGNFLYVPVGNVIQKYDLVGNFINRTVINITPNPYNFSLARDTVWCGTSTTLYGYACSRINGGSISHDATWDIGPGTSSPAFVAWSGDRFYVSWSGFASNTFKVFDAGRSLVDSGVVALDVRGLMCRSAPPPPDVGVSHLLAPLGTVDSGTVIAPACSVYNYGLVPAPNYLVRMRIGASYNQTRLVAGHAPGTHIYVPFAPWTASPTGTFAVICSTELAGDANPANDARRDSVRVRRVVGAEEPGQPVAWRAHCDVRPNPAPGRALVRFGLPAPGPYSLRLYDAGGRLRVVVGEGLAQSLMAPVAIDRRRQELAAGVYLLRLEGTGYTTTRKLLLE